MSRRTDHPEHRLQVAIVKWCRSQITEPHELLGFDRSRAQSARQHLYEAARGLRAGTPDLLLLFAVSAGRCCYWLELKSPDGVLLDAQRDFGARMDVLGHQWLVVRSVAALHDRLEIAGVRLAGTALWAGWEADARLEAALGRAKAGAPVRVKKRPQHAGERPAWPGRIRAIEAVRRRVLF